MQQQADAGRQGEQLTLGPGDEGRVLSHAAFAAAEWVEGYRYELVAGRLSVNPVPNPPHDDVATWLHQQLFRYGDEHPEVFDRLSLAARIQTRALGGETDVQPDLAAYRGYYAARHDSWSEVSPLLVVEVLSPGGEAKDTERNRALYWLVDSIEEYWILDPRADPGRPSLLALRRGPQGWIEEAVPAGGRYATPLLPGLELDLSTIYPA